MIVYLAYIRYDPEWCDLVSAHLHEETAEEAGVIASLRKAEYFQELYRGDPDMPEIAISHWVTPIQVQE